MNRRTDASKGGATARAFLRNVIDRVPIALFVKEAWTGRFVIYNSGAEQLFGVSRESLIGNTSRVFGPTRHASSWSRIGFAVEAGPVGTISERRVPAPMGERVIRIKKVAVEDGEAGGKLYILAAAEDVTEEGFGGSHHPSGQSRQSTGWRTAGFSSNASAHSAPTPMHLRGPNISPFITSTSMVSKGKR